MIDLFEQELAMIKNQEIKDFTCLVLEKAPPYFWEVPSSSTGKYHPPQSNGPGGLVRHTRAVAFLGDALCNIYDIVGDERDAVIAACLLHDVVKYGMEKSKWTTKTHDYDGALYIHMLAKQTGKDVPMLSTITGAVAWHMGRWTERKNGHPLKKFPEDFSRAEELVHVADCLSSRKQMHLLHLEESFIG